MSTIVWTRYQKTTIRPLEPRTLAYQARLRFQCGQSGLQSTPCLFRRRARQRCAGRRVRKRTAVDRAPAASTQASPMEGRGCGGRSGAGGGRGGAAGCGSTGASGCHSGAGAGRSGAGGCDSIDAGGGRTLDGCGRGLPPAAVHEYYIIGGGDEDSSGSDDSGGASGGCVFGGGCGACAGGGGCAGHGACAWDCGRRPRGVSRSHGSRSEAPIQLPRSSQLGDKRPRHDSADAAAAVAPASGRICAGGCGSICASKCPRQSAPWPIGKAKLSEKAMAPTSPAHPPAALQFQQQGAKAMVPAPPAYPPTPRQLHQQGAWLTPSVAGQCPQCGAGVAHPPADARQRRQQGAGIARTGVEGKSPGPRHRGCRGGRNREWYELLRLARLHGLEAVSNLLLANPHPAPRCLGSASSGSSGTHT